MTTIAEPEILTTEQLDAMPEDGMERWLIRGQLRERELTKRNRGHSWIETKIAQALQNWVDNQPEPRGEVLVGEAGIRLRKNPDTTVGVDVAYISAETADANPDLERILEGIPELIVEILSPSDKHEEIAEKVTVYLECGVKLVWVVDVRFRTITVYRSDAEPQLFNIDQKLTAEPHLSGFAVPVARLFSR
jgi:Uma2 family endonuclease